MEEKNKIRVSLRTVIFIFIIALLLVVIGGMWYYYNYIVDRTQIHDSNIVDTNIFDWSNVDTSKIVNKGEGYTYSTTYGTSKNDYVISNDKRTVTIGTDKVIKLSKNVKEVCSYILEQGSLDFYVFLYEDGTVVYTDNYGESIKEFNTLKNIIKIMPLDYNRKVEWDNGQMVDLKESTIVAVDSIGNIYDLGLMRNNVEESKAVGKIDINKDLVYTEYSKYSSEYSVSIPKININSQDVVDINNEIEKIIGEKKQEIQKWDETASMDYTTYINGEVLSVVIKGYGSSGYHSHKMVYNINIKTGEKYSNEELITVKGFTLSEFLDKLPNLYEKKFEEKCLDLKDEVDNSLYMERYNKTMSKENYGIDKPLFLDDKGDINVVAKIYQLAGGEAPYEEIIIVK